MYIKDILQNGINYDFIKIDSIIVLGSVVYNHVIRRIKHMQNHQEIRQKANGESAHQEQSASREILFKVFIYLAILTSPLWLPFLFLGFFWTVDYLFSSHTLNSEGMNAFALMLLCVTPFFAAMPIVIAKALNIIEKIFIVPVYILFSAGVIIFSAWSACFTFIGRCY